MQMQNQTVTPDEGRTISAGGTVNDDLIAALPDMARIIRRLAHAEMDNEELTLTGVEFEILMGLAGIVESETLFYNPYGIPVFAGGEYETGERYIHFDNALSASWEYHKAVRKSDGEMFLFKTCAAGEKGVMADFWMSRLVRVIRTQGSHLPALPAQLAEINGELGVLYPRILAFNRDQEIWGNTENILFAVGIDVPADEPAIVAMKAIIMGLTDAENRQLPMFLCSGTDVPFTLNHQGMLFPSGNEWGSPLTFENSMGAKYPDLPQFFPGDQLSIAREFWRELPEQRNEIRRLFNHLAGQFPEGRRTTAVAHIEHIIGMLGDPALFP